MVFPSATRASRLVRCPELQRNQRSTSPIIVSLREFWLNTTKLKERGEPGKLETSDSTSRPCARPQQLAGLVGTAPRGDLAVRVLLAKHLRPRRLDAEWTVTLTVPAMTIELRMGRSAPSVVGVRAKKVG